MSSENSQKIISLKPWPPAGVNWYYYDDYVCIAHGDCREIAPTLGRFDLLLTDPPYGLADKLQGGTWGKVYEGAYKDWDAKTVDLSLFFEQTAMQIIWGGNYYALRPSRGWISWYKPGSPPTMADIELAWTSLDKNAKQITQSIAATNAERNGHPTMKPLRVIKESIVYAGTPKTIFDPFAGSGTTGRAAKDLGLHCTMIEREERYCEIAALRMSQQVLNFTS